jgi:general L-amino acid transport system substrate-binding protein
VGRHRPLDAERADRGRRAGRHLGQRRRTGRSGTNNPEINRLLGTEGNLGEMLGLEADWAVKAIAAVGNYGEIFEGNIGENTPIGLARGLNAQWTDGGLLYSPPFR